MVKLPDVLVLLGLALVATGLAMWSVPLALVVVGVVMVVGGAWSHVVSGGGATAPPELPVVPPPAEKPAE